MSAKVHKPFSPPLFVVNVIVSLAVLFGALALLAPGVWKTQWEAPWYSTLIVFLVAHFVNAGGEWVFHRYVLHAPLIPIFGIFWVKHTLHHRLTEVGLARGSPGKAGVVQNHYPITEPHQHESSFFTWYSCVAFGLVASIPLALAQALLPTAPIFLGGFLALGFSLLLYEFLHMTEHLSYEGFWKRKIEHPRFGKFWRAFYTFHLRHHADIKSNEAISGFFGLPIFDWIFGTYVKPRILYENGSEGVVSDYAPPRPRFGFIRWLDRKAYEAIVRYRAKQAVA